MIRARAVLVGLVALTAACGSKSPSTTPSTTAANTVVFTAALSPTNEVPPVTNAEASGTGVATITLNLTRDSAGTITAATVTFQVNLIGFPANTNLTAAHIHAGPNIAPATNPVVWGFFGAPFNDNNPNDFTMTPFATGVGGTFSGKWDLPEGNGTINGVPVNLTNMLPFILNGQAYINFHTVQFGGGEIRGVLLTPEPGTWFLVGGGLALLVRRRLTKR